MDITVLNEMSNIKLIFNLLEETISKNKESTDSLKCELVDRLIAFIMNENLKEGRRQEMEKIQADEERRLKMEIAAKFITYLYKRYKDNKVLNILGDYRTMLKLYDSIDDAIDKNKADDMLYIYKRLKYRTHKEIKREVISLIFITDYNYIKQLETEHTDFFKQMIKDVTLKMFRRELGKQDVKDIDYILHKEKLITQANVIEAFERHREQISIEDRINYFNIFKEQDEINKSEAKFWEANPDESLNRLKRSYQYFSQKR